MKRKNARTGVATKAAGIILAIAFTIFPMPPPLPASQSFGNLSLTDVKPRVITPNGDSKNDAVYFQFDGALSGLPVESGVYDINGAKIGSLVFNEDETALLWDGKDEQGKVVPSGIYVYSIKIGKNMATGTVVVAR